VNGYLGIACANCGNASDPFGVMYNPKGALVCFWCISAPVTAADNKGVTA
jgi:hypothetical protein